ncbi:MAG: translation initiation factor IF-2, partial [Acidobacteriota bacterium]
TKPEEEVKTSPRAAEPERKPEIPRTPPAPVIKAEPPKPVEKPPARPEPRPQPPQPPVQQPPKPQVKAEVPVVKETEAEEVPVVEAKIPKAHEPVKDRGDYRIRTFEARDSGRSNKNRGRKKNNNRYEQPRREETPESITVGDKIIVRDLAEKINRSPAEIIKKLMMLGMNTVSLNNDIDFEIAELIAAEYNVRVEKEKTEEELILEEIVDEERTLKSRPPVVTVMGHVDHGKTSLLDAIRYTNVVSKEAGGITQHIGAYQVEINKEKITFIDTPGHETFTAMRARGAQATDIVVLVVAADDGVMPQTIEAINHAKAAEVPIIVAVNKIDKENANPDRVMQQLTEYHLVPEEWGGDTICANVSAKSRQGIEHLLEMILLVSEMRELKANPHRPAEGVVVEGQLDKGRGPVATVLVQKGTLKVGDMVVCGTTFGKVRAMMDDLGERVVHAGPSAPVELLGLADVAMAGDRFRVVDDKVARQVAQLRVNEKRREDHARGSKVSLDDLFKQIKEGEVKELNLIVKGDVQGSVEALTHSLNRLSTDEVKVNVIHSGVGAVRETDVMLASASNAIIIGFNVRPDAKSRKYAEDEGIDVRLYRVIYETIEDVKKAMAGLLDPERVERFQGRAEVRATFKVPKAGTVAGCYVLEGKLTRNASARLLRDGVIIWEGKLSSLKRFKDDVREVLESYECGMGLEGFNDVREADIIETYTIEEIARTL